MQLKIKRLVYIAILLLIPSFLFAQDRHRPAGVKRIEGRVYGYNGTSWRRVRVDTSTRAQNFITYPHHEAHDGNRYYINYGVESLGAMAAPDDMITLTWTTPNTTSWEHFTFYVEGTGGWRVRLIEAPTGGATDQTEQFVFLNVNRNSENVSSAIALYSTAGEASYDATLATGGTALFDDWIKGSFKLSGSTGLGRDELILKQNSIYQRTFISGADNNIIQFRASWYEHTNGGA